MRNILAMGALLVAACDGPIEPGASIDAATDHVPSPANGSYLVRAVLGCSACHTPRLADGRPDPDRFLAGVPCFISSPAPSGRACLHAPNLTNHADGLGRYDDVALARLLGEGVRPDGSVLAAGQMPYYSYALLSAADLADVIAYLRTVPPIAGVTGPSDPPYDGPYKPAAALRLDELPGSGLTSAWNRGRYLAAVACLSCHSSEDGTATATAPRPVDVARAYAGGRGFLTPAGRVHAPNLTPDATGLASWDAAMLVKALQTGLRPDGTPLCAPMPTFAMLADTDADAIAEYLLSLPAFANAVARRCGASGRP